MKMVRNRHKFMTERFECKIPYNKVLLKRGMGVISSMYKKEMNDHDVKNTFPPLVKNSTFPHWDLI